MAHAQDVLLTVSFGLVRSSTIVHIVTVTLLFFTQKQLQCRGFERGNYPL